MPQRRFANRPILEREQSFFLSRVEARWLFQQRPQSFILKDIAGLYHPLVMPGAHQLDRWPFPVWGARLLDAGRLNLIRTVTSLPINLFPRTWISTPFLCYLACSCAGSRRKYDLSHSFRAIFGKGSIDVLPRMALTDSLSYQNLGHINSSHLFKGFFGAAWPKAILAQIYIITTSGLSGLVSAKTVRNILTAILCSNSSRLTWCKLHIKFRSQWAAESAIKLPCQFESAA